MKKFNLKSVLLTAVAVSLSVFTFGQVDKTKMKMKHADGKMMNMHHNKEGMMQHKEMAVMLNDANLNKAYRHYTMIRKDLFKADTKRVKMMSNMLVAILNTYGKAKEAVAVAVKLAASTDIEGQRKLFAELTLAFEPLLKGQVAKGAIYKSYCPMANGTGAYWFSNSETIVNPYMGSAMPSCGEVKETFKVN